MSGLYQAGVVVCCAELVAWGLVEVERFEKHHTHFEAGTLVSLQVSSFPSSLLRTHNILNPDWPRVVGSVPACQEKS